MSGWIEINLPFYIYGPDSKFIKTLPKYPNLNRKAKKKLVITLEENDKSIMDPDNEFPTDGKIFQEYDIHRNKINEKISKLKIDIYSDEGKQLRRKKLIALKNEAVNKVIAWFDFKDKYREWVSVQPEVIKWQDKYNKLIDAEEQRIAQLSFCGRGLNNPGTLIEVEINGELKQFLVGDINCLRGVCDDCTAFDNETIVKRYMVVWSKGD